MEDREERVDEITGKKEKGKVERLRGEADKGERLKAAKMPDVRVLEALHYLSIHTIRKFSVDGYLLRMDRLKEDAEALELLASRCKNGFALAVGLEPNNLHCAIKLYEGKKGIPEGKWKVWTLARSEEDCPDTGDFRDDLGPKKGQLARENSAYAALTGCFDGKTDWGSTQHVYNCFCCNDLTKHSEYVNTRVKWREVYKAGMVFPLRWVRGGFNEIEIKGFLSFDSKLTDIFTGTPCIFKYKGNPGAYFEELRNCLAYHVGGIIADVLATTIALQDINEDLEKETIDANGE